MSNRLPTLLSRAGAIAALVVAGTVAAQSYPAKPVRLVVPYAAGGATDIIGRAIGQKLTDALGQPVVVENRAGAGGNLGADFVAKSPADGYTLLLGTIGTHAINPSLYAKMPYDPARDFAPITLALTNELVLAVNPGKVAARNVAEFVALAKEKPGLLHFGSAGNGSSFHLAGELFNRSAGVQTQHVPYKGSAPALADLVSGQIDFMFVDIAGALPHIRAGKLRPLAVAGARRSALMKDVPTVTEAASIPGFAVSPWMGFFAPAGTPAAVVDRLNAELNRILAMPDVTQRLADLGAEPIGSTPADFSRHIVAEIEKWARVVKATGARID